MTPDYILFTDASSVGKTTAYAFIIVNTSTHTSAHKTGTIEKQGTQYAEMKAIEHGLHHIWAITDPKSPKSVLVVSDAESVVNLIHKYREMLKCKGKLNKQTKHLLKSIGHTIFSSELRNVYIVHINSHLKHSTSSEDKIRKSMKKYGVNIKDEDVPFIIEYNHRVDVLARSTARCLNKSTTDRKTKKG